MKPVSLLTRSLAQEQPAPLPPSEHALGQPSAYSAQIKNITLAYQSRPSMMHDGKDWARLVLENPSEHHQMAVKWAREVLKGGE